MTFKGKGSEGQSLRGLLIEEQLLFEDRCVQSFEGNT